MTILRSGVCAFVSSAKPSYEYGSQAGLLLKVNAAVAFVQFGLPPGVHRGEERATILTATLGLEQSGGWSGSRTLAARRVTGAWTSSRVNWNNQPTAASSGAAVTQSGDTTWEFSDSHIVDDMQAWVNGTARNYGWKIVTSDTVGRYIQGFPARTGKPTLEFTYAFLPAQPTTLNPSAGAVSIAKPYLSWDGDPPSQIQVQIDPAANGTTPAFDTGWLDSDVEELDLSTTAYAGLANGATTQWRVRTKDEHIQASLWSSWATFNRTNKPTLTITSPTTVVSDSSPSIDWTFAGQTRYQVTIADASAPSKLLYDTGQVASTATSHTPSKAVVAKVGHTYRFMVAAWDNVLREVTTGDPRRVQAFVNAPLSYDATVTAVTWISADSPTAGPEVNLAWSRASEPDGWSIFRDEVLIFTTQAAETTSVGGTVYSWRDWTAAPNREHVYRVAAITNGKTAAGGPTVTFTPQVGGVWLCDPDTRASFSLGDATLPTAAGEDATVFTPIGATRAVRIVYSKRGIEGDVAGTIEDWGGRTWDDYEADLRLLEADPSAVYRLVGGDINIPVTAGNFVCMPHPDMLPDHMMKTVSFSVLQAGELPFDADF